MDNGLDLPDWNVGMQMSSPFECSPVKQPLAQVTLKDGNTQRVSALGRQGAAPAAGHKQAVPAVASIPAPLPRPGKADAENDASALQQAATTAEAPRSARRTHTPGKTGLTRKAVRLPSRLGTTPGAKQMEHFEVPVSAAAAATQVPPPTGNNLKSILKRLTFSTTKGQAAAPATAAPLTAAAPPAGGPSTSSLDAAAAAPVHPAQPQSTIKQLRFDMGTTPATATRHVTFDAATVSPAARTVRTASRPSVAFKTPEPTIQEEDSGEDAADGGSINSRGAGHTPYDRRLSSLFRKYQVAGTPELPDAELEDLVAEGAIRSPSWKRLSSASVPESIRELSKKYDPSSDDASLQGLTPPAASPMLASPAPAGLTAMDAEEAATPIQQQQAGGGGEESSPTMEPTPHHMLDDFLQRNALYESSPAEVPAAGQGPQPTPASTAAPAEANTAALASQLSPGSALAKLLAPVLLATIDEIGSSKNAAPAPQPEAAASPAPSSPAEFYGFPVMEAATPAGASPSPNDGVPRNAEGIPTVTPATVTVRRGGYASNLGAVLEDDDLAANLFDSFSPAGASLSGSPGLGSFSPAGAQPAEQQQQESQLGGHGAVTPMAAAETAASEDREFSFFPVAASRQQQAASAAAEGTTPELAGLAGSSSMEAPGTAGISPEILGFYEQEARKQAAAGAGSSSQAGTTPMLPRSIIKSGHALRGDGTPVLGHAQRAPADAPPHTITRELQALMADLRLEDRAEIEQMGTVSTLSPVRTTGSLRGFLGSLAKKAITPVRRSARKKAPQRSVQSMLEETGYSYVPNTALMAEDAQPQEQADGAEAEASSQAVDSPAAAAAAAGGQEAGAEAVAREQAQVESATTPGRRYSTRSAGHPAECSPETAGPYMQQLMTPLQLAHQQAEEPMATPQAAVSALDAPVAQDASPQLQDSLNYAATPAAAATPRYSLRNSTLKKSRRSVGTPLAAAPMAASSGTKGREASPQLGQLSPTEQGIRAALRRSARKSQGPKP